MTTILPPPMSGPSPTEVSLPQAPLVRVIAQVRFPTILSIRNPDQVAAFQETVRSAYPILNQEQVRRVVLNPLAPVSDPKIQEDIVWRFQDRDRKWRTSLTADFIALETTSYNNRRDFLERLRSILVAIDTTMNPQEALRVGVRYIDRITGPALQDISNMIRPEVLGVSLCPIGDAAQTVLTQSQFRAEEGSLQARWGHLPPDGTIDPGTLEPIKEPCWILDLDMSSTEPLDFSADILGNAAERFMERIYSVFRWMVTDDFLRFYGGQP